MSLVFYGQQFSVFLLSTLLIFLLSQTLSARSRNKRDIYIYRQPCLFWSLSGRNTKVGSHQKHERGLTRFCQDWGLTLGHEVVIFLPTWYIEHTCCACMSRDMHVDVFSRRPRCPSLQQQTIKMAAECLRWRIKCKKEEINVYEYNVWWRKGHLA